MAARARQLAGGRAESYVYMHHAWDDGNNGMYVGNPGKPRYRLIVFFGCDADDASRARPFVCLSVNLTRPAQLTDRQTDEGGRHRAGCEGVAKASPVRPLPGTASQQ